jgi:hypothetical protein
MVKLVDYARLSYCVYSDVVSTPVDWELIDCHENKKSGLKLAVFRKEEYLVFSVRGTAGLPNLKTDLGLVFRKHPAIFDEAASISVKICKDYPGAKFRFTGHSLGGLIAGMLALRLKSKAHVFEAPGAYPFVIKRPDLFDLTHTRITNYVVHQVLGEQGRVCNLVDTAFDQLGDVVGLTIMPKEGGGQASSSSGKVESSKLVVCSVFSPGSNRHIDSNDASIGEEVAYRMVDVKVTHSMRRIQDAIQRNLHAPVKLRSWPVNQLARKVHSKQPVNFPGKRP